MVAVLCLSVKSVCAGVCWVVGVGDLGVVVACWVVVSGSYGLRACGGDEGLGFRVARG